MDIRENAIQSIDQLASAVTRLTVDQYQQPLEILSGNSIGKHVRHVVEFYECLDGGVTQLVLNYDDRRRNMIIENDPDYALMRMAELQEEISKYEEKLLTLLVLSETHLSFLNI